MKARWLLAAVAAAGLTLAACGDEAARGSDDDSGASLGQATSQARNGQPTDLYSDGGGANQYNAGIAATPAGGTKAAPNSESVAPDTTGGDPALPAIDPNRKIIFTANIALNADDVSGAFTSAGSLARSNGAYIEKSAFANNEDDGKRSASMTIRVPVQNYDSLVASLRTIQGVSVATEGSNSSEVTEQYTDLQSRQRNLERTEQQYLGLLAQAKTIQEILTVQDRLSTVRSQIEQIQGRLKVLDSLTDFATVNLTISPVVAKVKEAPKDTGWTLSEVFVESWERSLEMARYVAAAGLVAVVAMAWLVVPLALGLIAARKYRRRPQQPVGQLPAPEGS